MSWYDNCQQWFRYYSLLIRSKASWMAAATHDQRELLQHLNNRAIDVDYYEEYSRAVIRGAETLIKKTKRRASFMAWRRCNNLTKRIWYLWDPPGQLSLPRPKLSAHGRALGYTSGVQPGFQRPPDRDGMAKAHTTKSGSGPKKRWGN